MLGTGGGKIGDEELEPLWSIGIQQLGVLVNPLQISTNIIYSTWIFSGCFHTLYTEGYLFNIFQSLSIEGSQRNLSCLKAPCFRGRVHRSSSYSIHRYPMEICLRSYWRHFGVREKTCFFWLKAKNLKWMLAKFLWCKISLAMISKFIHTVY